MTYEIRDPGGVIVNDGTPPHYNARRLIEFSDCESWHKVSQRLTPLFEEWITLSSNSALHGEAPVRVC